MKPNIVYILADDMGYGDVSYLNEHAAFQTPNFDRLCCEGMCFTDAHATSAVCTPSRYGILTGRYNWRSQLKSGVLGGYSPSLIEPGRMTAASLLRDCGYHTYCVGKWHLGLDWVTCDDNPCGEDNIDFTKPLTNGPTSFGFDHFYGIAASLDMPPYTYIEDDHPTALPDYKINGRDGKEFFRAGWCSPDFKHEEVLPKLTQHALSVIEENRDHPFYLYFPLPAPHTPILPTEEYQGKSGTNAYGDFVLMCDGVVGKVLDKLKECGIEENTIVIFTADNGCSPMADYSELAQHGHNPSYIFRGTKADIYEGGHRIPLLLRWPAEVKPGSTCSDTVCLCDFLATMADIQGVSLPDNAGEDSVSNLPLWLSKPIIKPIRDAIVHQSIDGSLSIRKGRFKLEMCPGSGGWSYPKPGQDDTSHMPSIQLYDLSQDIGETVNVQDQFPDVVKELKDLLVAYYHNGRSTPGENQINNGDQYWDAIQWLKDYHH